MIGVGGPLADSASARPLLGLGDVGDADHRPVLGELGEHRRPQLVVRTGLGERQFQEPPDVVVVLDDPVGQQQVGVDPRSALGSGLRLVPRAAR